MASAPREHPSPICSKPVSPSNPRYPQQVCRDCRERPCSRDGRPVHFTNVSPGDALPGMRLRAFYPDTAEPYATALCTIDGVECVADEAYMGGVVVQPLSAWRESPAWSWMRESLQEQGADV